MNDTVRWFRGLVRRLVENKIEKPEIGYHVAPREKHFDIKHDGILPLKNRKNIRNDPTASKTYFWSDLDTAKWFRNVKDKSAYEIWKVDLSGLNMIPDPETKDMKVWSTTKFGEEDKWKGWYYEGKVPSDRIIKVV